MAPVGAAARAFAVLPDAARWQAVHARTPAATAGSVRTTSLGDAQQTLAVIAYVAPDASAFDRLTLAGRAAKELGARSSRSVTLASLTPDAPADVDALLAAVLAAAFALPDFKSKRSKKPGLERVVLAEAQTRSAAALAPALAAARANNLTRWLTALPPNRLTTRAYRDTIAALARRHRLRVRWYDERELRRLGAGAFLAVCAGNAERGAAGIAHVSYRPPRRRTREPDVALVGKGILFDTGGNNLKPHRSMLDMHIDMSGSAAALSTLVALAELRAPLAADCWLAITENRIGPNAYRPQDVVTAANGVTIQVIHTDAEGRMVLADTLALAGRTKPRLIVDFATLTGACIYALTERMSGVFTNTPALVAPMLAAGDASGERVWNFPMPEDYDGDLESRNADVVQCTVDGKGDHILAARFLSRFVPKGTPWAHVDMSSVMRSGGLAHVTTDLTGFGPRWTLELLLRQRALDAIGGRNPRDSRR